MVIINTLGRGVLSEAVDHMADVVEERSHDHRLTQTCREREIRRLQSMSALIDGREPIALSCAKREERRQLFDELIVRQLHEVAPRRIPIAFSASPTAPTARAMSWTVMAPIHPILKVSILVSFPG